MLDGDLMVYVGQAQSPAVDAHVHRGRPAVPAHCTAVGKAILADEDPAARARAPAAHRHAEPRTEHTITDPDVFLASLADVRRTGYAVDDQEQELGVRCVAVAVPDAPSRIAMSVSGRPPG